MSQQNNHLELIANRFHRKITDITLLKMQMLRDEQDMINEFIEDMLEMCEEICEDKQTDLQSIFRGPNYNVRYSIPPPDLLDD